MQNDDDNDTQPQVATESSQVAVHTESVFALAELQRSSGFALSLHLFRASECFVLIGSPEPLATIVGPLNFCRAWFNHGGSLKNKEETRSPCRNRTRPESHFSLYEHVAELRHLLQPTTEKVICCTWPHMDTKCEGNCLQILLIHGTELSMGRHDRRLKSMGPGWGSPRPSAHVFSFLQTNGTKTDRWDQVLFIQIEINLPVFALDQHQHLAVLSFRPPVMRGSGSLLAPRPCSCYQPLDLILAARI